MHKSEFAIYMLYSDEIELFFTFHHFDKKALAHGFSRAFAGKVLRLRTVLQSSTSETVARQKEPEW